MEKDNFFQELKGLCIIAVILIHLPIGNEADGTFNYWLSLRSIINFPVAMFIFLSGYFDKRVQQSRLVNNTVGNQIISRLKRLVPPYLVWSTVYLAFSYCLGQELSVTNVITSYITGNAYGHLYYLIVLIQLTLLSPIIFKMIKTNNKLWLYFSVSITFLWILFIYIYSFYYKKTLPLYATLFPAWLFFYYFGMYKRFESENQDKIKKNRSIINLLMLLFFAIILSLFESNILYNYTKMAGFASSQIKFSSFIFVYVLIEFMIKIKKQNLAKTSLSKIGDYSFGIYLIHYIFVIPTSSLIKHLNIPEYLFIIEQASILAIVLGICYLLIYIANKFLNCKIIYYLGLK